MLYQTISYCRYWVIGPPPRDFGAFGAGENGCSHQRAPGLSQLPYSALSANSVK